MKPQTAYRWPQLLAVTLLVGVSSISLADEDIVPVAGGGTALVDARAANLRDDVVFEIQDSMVYVGSFWYNLRFNIRAVPGASPTILGDATLSSSTIYFSPASGGGSLGSEDGGTITVQQGASDFYNLRFEAVGSTGTGLPVTVENVVLDGAGTGGFSKRLVWIQSFSALDAPTKVIFNNVVFDRKGSPGYALDTRSFSTPTKLEFVLNECTFLDVGVAGAAFYTNGSWGELDFTRCRFDLGEGARAFYLGNNADAIPTEDRSWTLNVTECWVETENGQGLRLGGAFAEWGDYAQVNLTRSALVDYGTESGNNIDVGTQAIGAVVNIVHCDLIRGGDPLGETIPQNILMREIGFDSTVSIIDSNIIGYNNLVNDGLDAGDDLNVADADYSLLLTPPDQPGFSFNWDLGANMVLGGEAPDYDDAPGGDFRYTNVNQEASSTGIVLGSNFNFVTFEYGGGVTPPVLGDIDGDGIINVADVTALANLVAGGNPPSNDVGDINSDGSVDELDVQALAESIVD